MTPERIKILEHCKDLAGKVRRESFGLASEWILNNAKSPSILLETGRFRGNGEEGKSTLILAILAQVMDVSFLSVDFEAATVPLAKVLLDSNSMGSYASHTTLLTADSTQTISNLSVPVCFCYLDSAQSPQLELAEATALVDKMTKPGAILIDDCGESGGKSVLSVPFLKSRGWKLVFAEFQRFLIHE